MLWQLSWHSFICFCAAAPRLLTQAGKHTFTAGIFFTGSSSLPACQKCLCACVPETAFHKMEDGAKAQGGVVEVHNWVCCDRCSKWRRVPEQLALQLSDDVPW